jgi:hypothetical protein
VNGTLNDVPAIYRDLDGKKVVLEGFPYPTNYSGDAVPEFQFVYNIAKCCFGGPPKVQERVFAHTKDGSAIATPLQQFATLEGTLHVRLKKEAGHAVSLYDLDIEKVTAEN